MNPIGGYFELADRDIEQGTLPVEGILLNTARNALEYIVLQLQDVKRIFLPYYTCEAVIEPLQRLSVEFIFYRINSFFEIVEDLDLKEGEYLIANNYFGLKDAYMLTLSKKYGSRLIIDNAQALFSPVLPGIKAVYSTRKYVGVADGGIAVGVSSSHLGLLKYDDTSTHSSHLRIRKERGAEAGFAAYQANECLLDNHALCRMSPETKELLSHIDYKQVIERRSANYAYLHSNLGFLNTLQLPEFESFVCPMVYPFMSKNDSDLRSKLIEHKVFVARYWPNVLEWTTSDSYEYHLASRLIPLPIDQRYGKEDMDRIIQLIKQ